MRLLIFVIVGSFLLAPAFAQTEAPSHPMPPLPGEVTLTDPPPAEAPDTTEEGWKFEKFGGSLHLHEPFTPSNPLQRHALVIGICDTARPVCSATLYGIRMRNEAGQMMFRYAIQNADGARMEGYAFASKKTGVYRYFRYRDEAWQELSKNSSEVETEGTFVAESWGQLDFLNALRELRRRNEQPVPNSNDTVY